MVSEVVVFFFFKQKTAYEMRISDWSSDVCSSDLPCHFESDPIMPGCLGLDAMWQLVGFFLGWMKAPGKGRAISVGEVKFSDMVTPAAKKITFKIDIKKVLMRKFGIAIADGTMFIEIGRASCRERVCQ